MITVTVNNHDKGNCIRSSPGVLTDGAVSLAFYTAYAVF